MDMIFNCAFCVDVNCLNYPENALYQHAKAYLQKSNTNSFLSRLLSNLNCLQQYFFFLGPIIFFLFCSVYFYEFQSVIIFIWSKTLHLLNSFDNERFPMIDNELNWLENYMDKVIDLRSLCQEAPPHDFMQFFFDAQVTTNDLQQKLKLKVAKKLYIIIISVNHYIFPNLINKRRSKTIYLCSYWPATSKQLKPFAIVCMCLPRIKKSWPK